MTTPSPQTSLLFSYRADAFMTLPVWHALVRILAGDGVCCGVGGPRGAGKSWLLNHAVTWTRAHDGVGIYFASPRTYDPSSFLAALCAALAAEVERTMQPPHPRVTAVTEGLAYWPVRLALGLLLAGATVIVLRIPDAVHRLPYALIGAAVLLLYLSAPSILRRARISRNPRFDLYLRARALRQWIQFSATTTMTSEHGLDVGKGIVARLKAQRQVALSERPVTELSLVAEFRSLAEAVTLAGIRLVVAVDELDKLDSVDHVRSLLRDIKGVLDPAGVVLLVAVSDEAATHLGLGGVRGRDELSSSFGTTLRVPPLDSAQCEALVASRLGIPMPRVARALVAVSAGVPRNVMRLLDNYLRCRAATGPDGPIDDPRRCLALALQEEADDLITGLLAEPAVGDTERLGAYRWLHTHVAGPDRTAGLSLADVCNAWNPPWAMAGTGGWPADVAEHWRRFLIRAATFGIVWRRSGDHGLRSFDASLADGLRRMVWVSSNSAAIARHIGEHELGVLPPRPWS